jgi:uncharacterized protein YllA (UPF0747 family)
VRPFYAALPPDRAGSAAALPSRRTGRSWCNAAGRAESRRRRLELGAALEALRQGAGAVVTGQQVGLFGGPLFTPFKAATAIARARQATAAGRPHAAIFWLASEDHDFAEINHVVFPARES